MASSDARIPEVPTTILKRRKTVAKQKANEARLNLAQRTAQGRRRPQMKFQRAESFVKQSRYKQRDTARIRKQAQINADVPCVAESGPSTEPKLAFVVRVRGSSRMHPRAQKILQLFRLRHVNNGVFLQLNAVTTAMLQIVDPCITWGYPSLKTIQNIILKRGAAKLDGKRVPITDNKLIEERLGKYDMICIEDIINEIYTLGPNFKHATDFMWTFKLDNPTGGWGSKGKHFREGGDYGNREKKINEVLKKMI